MDKGTTSGYLPSAIVAMALSAAVHPYLVRGSCATANNGLSLGNIQEWACQRCASAEPELFNCSAQPLQAAIFLLRLLVDTDATIVAVFIDFRFVCLFILLRSLSGLIDFASGVLRHWLLLEIRIWIRFLCIRTVYMVKTQWIGFGELGWMAVASWRALLGAFRCFLSR